MQELYQVAERWWAFFQQGLLHQSTDEKDKAPNLAVRTLAMLTLVLVCLQMLIEDLGSSLLLFAIARDEDACDAGAGSNNAEDSSSATCCQLSFE